MIPPGGGTKLGLLFLLCVFSRESPGLVQLENVSESSRLRIGSRAVQHYVVIMLVSIRILM